MFQDAEPLNDVAASAGVDFLGRRLQAKGSEIAVTARFTLVVSADTAVQAAFYDAATGGTLLALGELNDGNDLVAGRLYAFEVDLARGQWLSARTVGAAQVTGSVTILGQP